MDSNQCALFFTVTVYSFFMSNLHGLLVHVINKCLQTVHVIKNLKYKITKTVAVSFLCESIRVTA